MRRWDRIVACIRAGLDDLTIARACEISLDDAALYRKWLDKGERVRARPDDVIDLMLKELGLTRCEAYYLLRTTTKAQRKKYRGGQNMNEIMKAVRMPAIDMMLLARENRDLRERCAALEESNAVLSMEIENWEKDYARLIARAQTLQDERDDARHERNCLRKRRDRAYLNAFAQNRIDRKGAKKIERALFALLTAAWGIPAMVILMGKAVEWARWMMGM